MTDSFVYVIPFVVVFVIAIAVACVRQQYYRQRRNQMRSVLPLSTTNGAQNEWALAYPPSAHMRSHHHHHHRGAMGMGMGGMMGMNAGMLTSGAGGGWSGGDMGSSCGGGGGGFSGGGGMVCKSRESLYSSCFPPILI